MEINKIWEVYFSPTGGTKKIVSKVARTIGEYIKKDINTICYTEFENRQKTYSFNKEDLIVFGMPVYAGRVPNKILPDIEKGFIGNNAKVIPISVYGNRSFDDGLIELKNILHSSGFDVIAGAGIVSKHAFSDILAKDRPDKDDMKEIEDFAIRVANNIINDTFKKDIKVKGNNPLGPYYTPLKEDNTPAKFLKAKPVTNKDKCNNCGLCAKVCPMKSIDFSKCDIVNGVCIKCQACVKICPNKAKEFDDEQFLSHVRMLEKNYMRRAKNYFF